MTRSLASDYHSHRLLIFQSPELESGCRGETKFGRRKQMSVGLPHTERFLLLPPARPVGDIRVTVTWRLHSYTAGVSLRTGWARVFIYGLDIVAWDGDRDRTPNSSTVCDNRRMHNGLRRSTILARASELTPKLGWQKVAVVHGPNARLPWRTRKQVCRIAPLPRNLDFGDIGTSKELGTLALGVWRRVGVALELESQRGRKRFTITSSLDHKNHSREAHTASNSLTHSPFTLKNVSYSLHRTHLSTQEQTNAALSPMNEHRKRSETKQNTHQTLAPNRIHSTDLPGMNGGKGRKDRTGSEKVEREEGVVEDGVRITGVRLIFTVTERSNLSAQFPSTYLSIYLSISVWVGGAGLRTVRGHEAELEATRKAGHEARQLGPWCSQRKCIVQIPIPIPIAVPTPTPTPCTHARTHARGSKIRVFLRNRRPASAPAPAFTFTLAEGLNIWREEGGGENMRLFLQGPDPAIFRLLSVYGSHTDIPIRTRMSLPVAPMCTLDNERVEEEAARWCVINHHIFFRFPPPFPFPPGVGATRDSIGDQMCHDLQGSVRTKAQATPSTVKAIHRSNTVGYLF
ncbi:hypothetical protein F5I97DRAFT_2073675 [Phlebopus sp. FC_14]|nr:hypothetical protein F5I97DRAFT_2073675 [Phlebopus sp. FC_14]